MPTVLNLLWLLCIAFVPFPTAVLAEYMRQQDQMIEAVLLFGATFTITAIAANALWLWVATNRNLIDDHVSEVRIRSRTRRYLPGPLLYGVGLPLAFVSPWISVGLYGAPAVFYLLPLNDATS